MNTEMIYITLLQIKENLSDRNIYIYGSGADGKELIANIESLNPIGFIDTYKEGNIGEYKCIKLSNYSFKEKDFIIIASSMYYQSMVTNLNDLGLKIGEDYAVYDKDFFFSKNDSINKIIKWNKLHFYPPHDTVNRILIPFENVHDSSIMFYAYYSNYYSEKYNAVIDCFIRRGGRIDNTSPVIREMYESFGANIINIEMNQEQENESKDIFNRVWASVNTVEDIKNIYIYGIHFGTTIIRDYLRYRIPHINVKDDEIKSFIKERVNHIVFWYHRIMEYDYKVVILWDGVHWEGYIREIAIAKGIPCYALHYTDMRKMFPDFYYLKMCEYYPEFWDSLSDEEKSIGKQWARDYAKEMVNQWIKSADMHKSIVQDIISKYELDTDQRIRLVITPHIYDEDCYHCGEQVFDDDYFSWLCHLGELSESTDYVWFIKPHPAGGERDAYIIKKLTQKYTKLHLIPTELNAIDLKRLGVQFGLTVDGTIGEEYPVVGIQVINAGKNPHDRYNFNINPKSKQEYDEIITHLDKYVNNDINIEEIYEFYAIHRLYYDNSYFRPKTFWDDSEIDMDEYELKRIGKCKRPGTWKYELIIPELNEIKNHQIYDTVKAMSQRIESIRYDIFYKKSYGSNDLKFLNKQIIKKLNSK